MTPEQVLERAADLIEERGWAQGQYEDPDGCLCTIGAVRVAIAGSVNLNDFTPDQGRLLKRCWPVLDERIAATNPDNWVGPYRGPVVADWNDTYAKTADEVVAVLRGSRQPDPAGAAPVD